MKRLLRLLLLLAVLSVTVLTASAASGSVFYQGDAKEIVFAPGGEESLTDLFPDMKGLMPGDTVTQKITLRSNTDDDVKTRIFLRAIGIGDESKAFLSQLHMTVRVGEGGSAIFDASPDQTAGLTDPVLLGELYAGGEVDIYVTIVVPVTLGNEFQGAVGVILWQFIVEEIPIDPDDPPVPPPTTTPPTTTTPPPPTTPPSTTPPVTTPPVTTLPGTTVPGTTPPETSNPPVTTDPPVTPDDPEPPEEETDWFIRFALPIFGAILVLILIVGRRRERDDDRDLS